jgi:hypothetical protein
MKLGMKTVPYKHIQEHILQTYRCVFSQDTSLQNSRFETVSLMF